MQLVAIAIGGALGAVSRYLFTVFAGSVAGVGFPWGTLGVNVIGSLVMGLLVVAFDSVLSGLSNNIKLMLTIGFLGSFTTFSTFSMDTMRLFEGGQTGQALGYVALSLVLSVLACAFGLLIARNLVS